MRMRSLLIALFALLLFACKGKQANKNVLPVSSMKLILWDILKADEWYIQTAIRDTLHKRVNENFQIYEQVYKIHHITKEQFYSSYKFYETHPDQFKTLIDSVIAVGDRDKVIEKSGPAPVPANPK
jgi:hypothetical protein